MERAMLIDKRLCPRYTSDQTKRKSGENPQRMHLLSHKGRAAEGPSSNPWQTKNTQCIKGTKGKDRVVPLELSGRLTQQSLAVANPWGLYNSLRRMPLSQTPNTSQLGNLPQVGVKPPRIPIQGEQQHRSFLLVFFFSKGATQKQTPLPSWRRLGSLDPSFQSWAYSEDHPSGR